MNNLDFEITDVSSITETMMEATCPHCNNLFIKFKTIINDGIPKIREPKPHDVNACFLEHLEEKNEKEYLRTSQDLFAALNRHVGHKLIIKVILQDVDIFLNCLTCNVYFIKVWNNGQDPRAFDERQQTFSLGDIENDSN